MIKPSTPENEQSRLKTLDEYNILDTLEEKEYDQLTLIASEICDTPIALVSLIDEKRQWFKSHHGLDATETPREIAFCAHAINEPNEVLVVPDSSKDERFHDNPLATGAPDVIFYAGAPLNTPDGHSLGTLCVIDNKPREITEAQKNALQSLADQVIAQLELRKKNRLLNEKLGEVTDLNFELEKFSYRLSHDIRTPIRGIANITQWIIEDHNGTMEKEVSDGIKMILDRTKYMEALVKSMLDFSKAKKGDLVIETFNLKDLMYELKENVVDENASLNILMEKTDQDLIQSKIGLTIVLQNLITNSVKYAERTDCQISVALDVVDKNYHISFEDNGPGIPLEFQSKVFELFETLDVKSEHSTGIGLATVKSVIGKMGGTIQFDNEKSSGGARYLMILPIK